MLDLKLVRRIVFNNLNKLMWRTLVTVALGFVMNSGLVNAATVATGTEYISFWSGDLRVFAQEDNTEVLLVDIDTGTPLSLSDPRINSVNIPSNPFILNKAGDSFEGVGGLGGINDEIRVRVITSDPTGGADAKPVIVWTGSLAGATKHPTSPPGDGNPWMSYMPAVASGTGSNGREIGREFIGFTTKSLYLIARKGAAATSITVDDLVTNVDSDNDDSTVLNETSPEKIYSDDEIEVYFLNQFEDDTLHITSNVDLSVLVGYSASGAPDWTVTPPSYQLGDDGIELGSLFYTYVKRSLTVFPVQDNTRVTITDLSDGDDSITLTLNNGDVIGDYDLYTPTLDSTSSGTLVPRPSNPLVNVIDNGGNAFDDDIVKVESDKPVLVYVGPISSDVNEYADVAFSVPTGPDSRIIYTYAQNSGSSNDLQIFGFDPDTEVKITSLSYTSGFRNNGRHDFVVGPGIGGTNGWKQGTAGGDVWWGSDVWNGEVLRIESTKPITVINGDYDSPHFGAYIPFVLATPTLPPVADAGADQQTETQLPVAFDGSGSFDQDTVAGTNAISYEWDFDITLDSDGDGNAGNDVDATGAAPVHVYSAPGSYTIKLTFTDDDGESDTDFAVITVEGPPAVSGIICRAKDSKIDVVWDELADAVSYNVYRYTGSDKVLANTTTGYVFADFGLTNGVTYTYTVVAQLSSGIETTESAPCSTTPFARTRSRNSPPDITSSPVLSVDQNTAYSYDVDAIDPDAGDVLVYALATSPADMGIDPATGVISWTPGNPNVGSHVVTVTVQDAEGRVDSQSYNLIVSDVNEAPVITSTPITEATATQAYSYDVDASDPDAGDVVVFELTTAPAGMVIDEVTGLISWSPTESQTGAHPVAVRARDTGGLTATQSFSVTVNSSNIAPSITSSPVLAATEGVNYQYAVTATDPDGDVLSFSLDLAPGGMTINGASGLIDWTPTEAQVGTRDVTVRVSDSRGLFTTQSFTIDVANINDPPSITSSPEINATESLLYSYAVQAVDPDVADVLSFSLDTGPSGMSIDAATGIIQWIPSEAQVGTQDVTVRVTDNGGLFATQSFTINVANQNDAPTIVSIAPASATEGELYSYDVEATDSDVGDTLTYSFDTSPAGMTIDGATGLIQWTPTNEQVGNQNVTVRVSDTAGLFATQSYTIIVANTDEPPVITSTPVTGATVGELYSYDVNATDPDVGDTLTFSLDTAPAGMSIDPASGLIEWTPAAGDVGDVAVTVRVEDGTGLAATQGYFITVSEQPNAAPVISSIAVTTATEDQAYSYDVEATDPDTGDVLTFSLDTAPSGMSIDPATGLIQWTPTQAQVGDNPVTVRVSDDRGLFDSQSFVIVVAEENDAPVITSAPVTTANEGSLYGYNVAANDPDVSDTLSFSLDTAPTGMSIDPASGVIQWTPSEAQVGEQNVTVRVTDSGGLFATQSYVVTVANINDTPVITSSPVLSATESQPYSYNVEATDPDVGDVLSFSLDVAPAGMSIDPGTGLIQWTPSGAQVGDNTVTVRVTDSTALFATQSFTVNVAALPNQPPQISSTPLTSASVGNPYSYAVAASDPDVGDTLTFSLPIAPIGMSIDSATGLVQWTPASGQAGDHPVSVRVSDGAAFVEQSYTITVTDVALPLEVFVGASPAVIDLGETTTITVATTGGTGAISTELTVNGTPVALDGAGQAVVTGDSIGGYELIATANDSVESISSTAYFSVRDPADSAAPTVSIATPATDSEVTAPVDIVGTADDTNLVNYRLLMASAGSSDYQEIANSTVPVVNGVLGQFDPTTLANGLYDIALIANDANGQQSSTVVTYRVTGDMKVGNFSFTITDLSIPVAGIPITVNRTYDTRRKHENLDFGYGWSIDYQDVNIQENSVLGQSWTQTSSGGFFPIYCIEPVGDRLVIVTLPDGSTQSFEMTVSPQCQQLVPLQFVQPVFNALPGTTASIQAQDVGDLWYVSGQLLDTGTVEPYDPSRYTLTTKEGTVYELDQNFGIRTVTDTNGNTLTYTTGGITHSSGKGIAFTRDGSGRITAITDPNGNSINYTLSSRGDLAAVTDRAGNTTSYTYNRYHGLVDIIDPLGSRITRSIYDDNGRLIAVEAPDGSRTNITHNVEGREQIVTDRLGNTSILIYDESGNVVSETNALGETTLRNHNSRGELLSETNPLGQTTSFTYDSDGLQLTETNPLGETTSYTYDGMGNQLTETDPAGNVVETRSYDSQGNLTSISDAVGNITQFAYDPRGNLVTKTDPDGNTETYEYDSDGNRIGQTNERGVITTYSFDNNNNETSVTTTRTDESGIPRALTTSFAYDEEGRVTQEIDSLGNEFRNEYDAAGNQVAEVDSLGNRTEFQYDELGNLVLVRYEDGTTETSTYDAENNKVAETDRAGRTTSFVYDAAKRLVQTVYPDGTSTSIEYDAAGRVTANTDELGNRTSYTYDAAGRRTSTTSATGSTMSVTYDNRGFVTSNTDPLGNVTSYTYDEKGRRTAIEHADGSTTYYTYDSLGRKTQVTDQAGNFTSYGYDAAGNVVSITDHLGNTLTYQYDEQNNRIATTDANGETTRTNYDDLGRITSRILPGGQMESFSYDPNGNMLTHTDFNGQTINFEYDGNNRVIRKIYPDMSVIEFTYTPTGEVSTILDDRGITTYTYDERDRLVRLEYPDGNFIEYSYDSVGNVIALTTLSGIITNSYDVANRLASVTDQDGGVTVYSYDAAGNRESVTYPNGTSAHYTYDSLNRLIRLENRRADDTVISAYDYVLDAVGNRVQVIEDTGRTVDYTYDAMYRLTREVITEGFTTTTVDYSYDAVGNRMTKTIEGGMASIGYTYDENNRLLSEGSFTYTYDDNGNMLTKSDGVESYSYEYDSDNRLVEAVTPGGVIEVQYDANGNRVAKTVNGVTTTFVVDPNREYSQVVEERDSGNSLIVRYTYGDDLISQVRGASISYYHYDGLGSTRALTDASDSVTDRYDFDAYGIELNRTGSTLNNYLFTGEQYDPNTNFYYLRARYMDPNIGRFITADPFPGFSNDPVSLHKYQYADLNPVNKIDPSGKYSLAGAMSSISIGISLRSISLASFRFALRRVISTVIRIAKSGSQIVVREMKRCIRSPRRCKINLPVLVTGRSLPQTAKHIMDAQLGRGTSLAPSPAMLFRRDVSKFSKSRRQWYNRTEICSPAARAEYRARNGGATGGCDEYPYFSTRPGGPAFYPTVVSLRLISNSESGPQGRQILGFYTRCGIRKNGPAKRRVFMSFAVPQLPNFSWCGSRRR